MDIVHKTDYNVKREIIFQLYGMEGIGIYWYLIEWLYQLNGFLKKEDIYLFCSHFKTNYQTTLGVLLQICYYYKYIKDGIEIDIYYNKAIIDEIEHRCEVRFRRRERARKIKELEDEKYKKIPDIVREQFKRNYKQKLKEERFIKKYLDQMNGVKERKYERNES